MRWLLYFCNCTILHQTISNVSRYKFTFTAVYQYIAIACSSRKLVKIGGSPKPLEPPGFGPDIHGRNTDAGISIW